MPHYRTEVEVTADRYVCLQLPDRLPPGRAIVTVVLLPSDSESTDLQDFGHESDRDDIEWWEEFEDDRERIR
ncbi:hypothetical protein ACYOEI_07975 [Singulisphaera rosea]